MARMAVQDPTLMDRVMEVAVQIPVFKAKAIRADTINIIIRGISSRLVIRVTCHGFVTADVLEKGLTRGAIATG